MGVCTIPLKELTYNGFDLDRKFVEGILYQIEGVEGFGQDIMDPKYTRRELISLMFPVLICILSPLFLLQGVSV
jgi:hypothetical protein